MAGAHTPAAPFSQCSQQSAWQLQQPPRWQGVAVTPETQPAPARQNGNSRFQFSQPPAQQAAAGRGLSFGETTPAMHTPDSPWQPQLMSSAGPFTFGVPQVTPSPAQWEARQQQRGSDAKLVSHAILGGADTSEVRIGADPPSAGHALQSMPRYISVSSWSGIAKYSTRLISGCRALFTSSFVSHSSPRTCMDAFPIPRDVLAAPMSDAPVIHLNSRSRDVVSSLRL